MPGRRSALAVLVALIVGCGLGAASADGASTAWRRSPHPWVSGTTQYFNAATAAGQGDVWVAGVTTFAAEPLPALGTEVTFTGVAAGAGTVVVVGANGFSQPVLLARTGGVWKQETSNARSGYGIPHAAVIEPGGRAWAVGVGVVDPAGLILRR